MEVLLYSRGIQWMKSITDDNWYQAIPIDIDNRWPIIGEDSCGYQLVSIFNNNR